MLLPRFLYHWTPFISPIFVQYTHRILQYVVLVMYLTYVRILIEFFSMVYWSCTWHTFLTCSLFSSILQIDSEGFWRWCVTLRITRFLDCVHCAVNMDFVSGRWHHVGMCCIGNVSDCLTFCEISTVVAIFTVTSPKTRLTLSLDHHKSITFPTWRSRLGKSSVQYIHIR
jgi:hypothetical protein